LCGIILTLACNVHLKDGGIMVSNDVFHARYEPFRPDLDVDDAESGSEASHVFLLGEVS
jgi:hypothetical protein